MTSRPPSATTVEDPRVAGSPLFAALSRFDALWAAWERVRANNGAAGGDGVSVARFGAGADGRVAKLAEMLRAGRHRPGPSRRVFVPKASGGLRPLDIPCIADRVVYGATARVLTPLLEAEFEDSSFAYRPGRSVAQAVQRVATLRRAGYTHVVDGDIVRYFERVPHDPLLLRLERLAGEPRLIDLVALMLECHAPEGIGLPQGSPLSPLLANLYLDEVDEAIEGRGVRLVRFADDFVLLCKSADAAGGALERMRALLAERGLELHGDKTRIVPFDQGFRFLGHVFVRSMVWREVFADDLPGEDAVVEAERAMAQAALREAQDPQDSLPDAEEDVAPEPRGRFAAHQRLLYVLEPGRVLDAQGEAFVVTDGEATLLQLPHRRVDRIEVAAACAIATAALDLAAATDTEIVRIDGYGRETGRWSAAGDGERARRHLAQAMAVVDPQRRSALAQTIAAGRVFNQRTLLQRANAKRRDVELADAIAKLWRIWRMLDRKPMSVQEAMGQEGAAAAIYWPALARLAPEPWVFAGRRTRRVGSDPFNIVCDALSHFLARDARTAALRAGLHPGFGALHGVEDGSDALVYDLIEAFRAPLVEATALALFARKALTADDFVEAGGARRLGREGWNALVRGWETTLARPVREPISGERMTWRGVLQAQACDYARACETGESFRPYRMDF